VIVIDVNVIAYLLIEGEHTRTSRALYRADPEWTAPLLWRSEWRSVLSGYLRRGQLTLPEAMGRTWLAQALVKGREHVVDDNLVLKLVAESACSAYDCEYVALAETLDLPLVTNDRDVLDSFPKRAITPRTYLR